MNESISETYIINDLHCRDLYFEVPLDYDNRNAGYLNIFAREVASKEGFEQQLPYLVYFQGGPGFMGMPRKKSHSTPQSGTVLG